MISGFNGNSGASRMGLAILLSISCTRAEAQVRLPLIPPENLSAEQKQEVEVLGGREHLSENASPTMSPDPFRRSCGVRN